MLRKGLEGIVGRLAGFGKRSFVRIGTYASILGLAGMLYGCAPKGDDDNGNLPPPPPCVDDNYENNDSIPQATDLTGNEGLWHSAVILGSDPRDVYEIYVNTGFQEVIVDARFDRQFTSNDIEMTLQDFSGNIYTYSSGGPNGHNIDHIVPSGGFYYIFIEWMGGNSCFDYDLRWDGV